ncbi:MAG TPA: hypothetical protein VMU99_06155 [Acidimicrobiales bacterium]|nr:hypothetical protein [Acidimicrobiales bacterium]
MRIDDSSVGSSAVRVKAADAGSMTNFDINWIRNYEYSAYLREAFLNSQ